MKTFLSAIILIAVIGCSAGKEIQVELVKAELVKIDTIHRQPYDKKMLTWRDENNIQYVSFVAIYQPYTIGTSMLLLRQR